MANSQLEAVDRVPTLWLMQYLLSVTRAPRFIHTSAVPYCVGLFIEPSRLQTSRLWFSSVNLAYIDLSVKTFMVSMMTMYSLSDIPNRLRGIS